MSKFLKVTWPNGEQVEYAMPYDINSFCFVRGVVNGQENIKVGDRLIEFPYMECREISYSYYPYKWWQKIMFWKKKEIRGYWLKRVE